MVTPLITVTAGVSDRLTYWVKNQDAAFVEQYEVKLSNFGNTAPDFTTVLVPLDDAPSTWTQVTLDLTPYLGQSVLIGFHATSDDMFRLLFDDIVNDTFPTLAPDCATLVTPTDAATAVSPLPNVAFSWVASNTGGSPSSYDLYLDTNMSPATLQGNYFSASANVAGLLGNTTYYWKVIAKNNVGSAVGCTSVFSFTTSENPFSSYCGPLVFTTVEPITLVSFAGINNTTSETVGGTPAHETFLSQVGTVSTGQTYPITVKGNSDGSYTNNYVVFIDWNQNNIFNDAGEVYFGTVGNLQTINSTGVDAVQGVGNILVPTTALAGSTRMRVKKLFASTNFINPCLGGTFGQAEDYSLFVSTLATDTFDNANFKSYPNPVKDVLNLTYNKKITSVSVYNLVGQEIISKNVNSEISQIDMQSLASGTYMVRITSDNQVKTLKVVKE